MDLYSVMNICFSVFHAYEMNGDTKINLDSNQLIRMKLIFVIEQIALTFQLVE